MCCCLSQVTFEWTLCISFYGLTSVHFQVLPAKSKLYHSHSPTLSNCAITGLVQSLSPGQSAFMLHTLNFIAHLSFSFANAFAQPTSPASLTLKHHSSHLLHLYNQSLGSDTDWAALFWKFSQFVHAVFCRLVNLCPFLHVRTCTCSFYFLLQTCCQWNLAAKLPPICFTLALSQHFWETFLASNS